MSVESLPYTLLLLLAQFTTGVAASVLYVYLRGTFEAAFIRTCSWLTLAGAALLTLTVLFIEPTAVVDGYPLDSDVLDLLRAAGPAMLLFSLAFLYFVRREDEAFLATATGATTTGLGVIILIASAWLVREPAWSVAGPLLTLFAGAAVLGVTMVAMIWGHWYLVNPRLEEGPLNELSLITLGAILAATAATALNAIIPASMEIDSDALLAVDLASNPAFWLRVGIGLIFPAALAYMAYRSSRERAMMSATGLLYIAVGAVLAGEAVGRGLLFVTGSAV